ncbi:DUF948 domain-containing protein [bacterium]|nr:DUF948 domain-containing protein [bacterium]
MSIEISEIILNHGLTFLAVTAGIALIIITVYLVKLLKNLDILSKNLNETSVLINTELKPTLKELNETMRSINSLVQSTDEGVGNVKLSLENALSKTKTFSESLFGGFFKGFMTIYSLFARKK